MLLCECPTARREERELGLTSYRVSRVEEVEAVGKEEERKEKS